MDTRGPRVSPWPPLQLPAVTRVSRQVARGSLSPKPPAPPPGRSVALGSGMRLGTAGTQSQHAWSLLWAQTGPWYHPQTRMQTTQGGSVCPCHAPLKEPDTSLGLHPLGPGSLAVWASSLAPTLGQVLTAHLSRGKLPFKVAVRVKKRCVLGLPLWGRLALHSKL